MKCEVCGKENNDSALFCASCGKALKDTPIRLDLNELNIPAADRKAHIVKVSAKKSAAVSKPGEAPAQEKPSREAPAKEASEETPAAEPAAQDSGETPLIDLSSSEAVVATDTPAEPTAAAPMRIKNWIAVFILSAIPVVNLIMLLIWAISSKTNPSKRSYAQAMLIFSVILAVLGVAAVFAAAAVFHLDYKDVLTKLGGY